MIDRELMRYGLKRIFENEEELERVLDHIDYTHRNVRLEPNAIHFSYYNAIMSDEEIQTIRTEIKKANLELSFIDLDYVAQASFIETATHIVVHANLTEEILKNVAWDVFILLAKKAIIATKNKIFPKSADSNRKEIPKTTGITFEIERTPDNYRKGKFIFGEDVNEKSLDKGLKAMRKMTKDILQDNKSDRRKVNEFRMKIENFVMDDQGNWSLIGDAPVKKGKKKKKK